MVTIVRLHDGRNVKTRFCIIDAQSVKNNDTAEEKGYDVGKKVSGIKRHIAVDTNGLPHAIHVTTANITDRAGALSMFNKAKNNLSEVLSVLTDCGYTGEKFAIGVFEIIRATVEVVRRNELYHFNYLTCQISTSASLLYLSRQYN